MDIAAGPDRTSAVAVPGPAQDPPGGPEPCARCGRDADLDVGALWLCIDCYHVAGSTCAGIGVGPTPAEPVC